MAQARRYRAQRALTLPLPPSGHPPPIKWERVIRWLQAAFYRTLIRGAVSFSNKPAWALRGF